MSLRQVQEEMAKLQMLAKKLQDEENEKEQERKQNEYVQARAMKQQRAKEETEAFLAIKESWDNACEQLSIEQIKILLDKIHNIPFNIIEDKNQIEDTNPRRYCYRKGIVSAIKKGNLEVLKLLWDDFYLWIPKLYRFQTTTNALFDKKYCDENALILAICFKQEECALWLLGKGISPNSLYTKQIKGTTSRIFHSTALTLAIQLDMVELSKELIRQGAWIGERYTKEIEEWEQQGHHDTGGWGLGSHWIDRKLPDGFDTQFTPFMFAAYRDNKNLVNFFLEAVGASVLECNKNDKPVISFTSNEEIKQIMRATLANAQRMGLINFNLEDIPLECRCSATGVIMTRPAKDKYGNYFCQEAVLNACLKNPSQLRGPNRNAITEKQLLDLLSLPVDKERQLKCTQLVEEAESRQDSTLTYKKS